MEIGLGTVQFGLAYGVSNGDTKTSKAEVFKILDYLKSHSINILDTAPTYGDAERIIGGFHDLSSLNCVTKTMPVMSSAVSKNTAQATTRCFRKSLSNMNLNGCYGLLIHDPLTLFKPGVEFLIEALQEIKATAGAKKIGLSVYNPKEVDQALKLFDFDIIQLPISVFNQTFHKNGYIKSLNDRGVEVHARSIFHQGALLLEPQFLPKKLEGLVKPISNLRLIANEAGLSPMSLALSFMNSISGVHAGIVGVNSLDQLIDVKKSSTEFLSIDFDCLHISETNLNNPANWV